MITVTYKGERIKVLIRDGQFIAAYLPGDLMSITDQLTEEEKRILEKRAFRKMVRG